MRLYKDGVWRYDGRERRVTLQGGDPMFRRKPKKCAYDRENRKPVIRSSICTGEQVAGFRDIHTGKFQDIMLIRDESDLKKFKEMYGLGDIPKEY